MKAIALGVLASLQCGTLAFDLDACSAKPGFSASRCPAGSAVACWSMDTNTEWACWKAEWAPAWFVTKGASASNAACLSRATPELSGLPYYDGACTLAPATKAVVPPEPPLLSWAEAREKAEGTLGLMNMTEKSMLMQGTGWDKTKHFWDLKRWWYVGNTAPIPRVGIPNLNMQDAAGGFRTYWNELVGTVTCWPSLLSMAATWDPVAVRAFALALGQEFAEKGANAILGPSINVHRVARNGRNFEYLSGEDPFLGSRLAPAYVEGVQANGLLAVMKHWIFNEQETSRNSESSDVDPKTAFEIYYPPFKAAIEAGVDAAMCSYNKVNGVYSCENEEQLKVLKEVFGFKGFVQSDWWATHRTSVAEGLDQDMPGTDERFDVAHLSRKSPQKVDEAVLRILTSIYRANLEHTTKCFPPHCKPFYTKNVTSLEHAMLARTLATESVVLLQNKGDVLPFAPAPQTLPKMRIAIVGAAANASIYNPKGAGQSAADAWRYGDLYSGGGSGHVVAGYVVNALDGITARAEYAGYEVVSSASDDVAAALEAASGAHAVVIVAGATCGEAGDRADLSLGAMADALIEEVSKKVENTVVVMQIPGAVVMPWRNRVKAILAMFLGGQETGSAWGSVLFGDHNPTGRLPVMMPATEADATAPGIAANVPYSEKMETSYRNPNFKAAFPFGHGMTYTTFEYGPARAVQCGDDICVTVRIRNSGSKAGRALPQLYVEFSPEAGHPAPFLKGFHKTPAIEPGKHAEAHFRLTPHELSFYREGPHGWFGAPSFLNGDWKRARAATALIGESSGDIRQRLSLPLPEAEGGVFASQGWHVFTSILALVACCALGCALAVVANTFGLLPKKRPFSKRGFSEVSDTEESN